MKATKYWEPTEADRRRAVLAGRDPRQGWLWPDLQETDDETHKKSNAEPFTDVEMQKAKRMFTRNTSVFSTSSRNRYLGEENVRQRNHQQIHD